MSKKTPVVIGVSISPTHVGAVKLSAKDFRVEAQIHRPLPPAIISHDGKKLLDAPTLVPLLVELREALGNPEFTDPVYLSIYSPLVATRLVTLSTPEALQQAIEQEVGQQGWLTGDPPIMQVSLLWQQGEVGAVTYGAVTQGLIQSYCDAFYEAGLKVTALEMVPLSVFRGLAASGVLDALVHKVAANTGGVWGAFGVCGSQTWSTLWYGNQLLHLHNFTTPSDAKTWADRLLEPIEQLQLNTPGIWLVWQEAGQQPALDPLKLKLGAPVSPAVLGPMYGPTSVQPPVPALGAALKPEFAFPLGWDFMAIPDVAPVKEKYTAVPYNNYQPILPKLFHAVTLLGLIVVILASAGLTAYNYWHNQNLKTQEAAILALQADITQGNQQYLQVFQHVQDTAKVGTQLEEIRLALPEEVYLTGKAYTEAGTQQFLSQLTQAQGSGLTLKKTAESVSPVPNKAQLFQFDFKGALQASSTAAATQGQAAPKPVGTKKP